MHGSAHQRHQGEAATVRSPLPHSWPSLTAAAHCSTAVEQRERGALVRDAATWERNPFAAICGAARADAEVCRLLDMLEVRRQQPAGSLTV